ncbi:hypothetical protein D3C81_1398480 [compost metagenome]
MHMLCVRYQRHEFFNGLRRDQVTAAAADQQQRAFHPARRLGDGVLMLLAVARQFFHQARVPMPVPTAVGGGAQQRAQRILGFARTVRHVRGDAVGSGFQRGEAIRVSAHESEDALHAPGFPARGDIHQHHRREQAGPARFGHQPEQAAHRGRHQHRWAAQVTGNDDQVIGELITVIRQIGRIPVRTAMATRVIAERGVARSGHGFSGRGPSTACLTKAVGE